MGGRGTPSKRLTVGKHGVLTPDQARKDANEQLVRVDRGVDVAQSRKDERDKLTGLTFREMVERFLLLEADDTRYWREKRARLLSADTKAICDRPFAPPLPVEGRGQADAAMRERPSSSIRSALHSEAATSAIFATASEK